MGQVQQRYIFEGDGADQFLGRVAAGLPMHDEKFTVLPPRFKPSFHLTSEEWLELFPTYSRIPRSFQGCIPYLLASLVHHQEWLQQTLPSNHPLFRTMLWTSGKVRALASFVLVGNQECLETNMKATGIPQIISLRQQIRDQKGIIESLMQRMNINHEQVMESLPAAVAKHISDNFTIQGMVPVTQSHFDQFRREMLAEVREIRNQPSHLAQEESNRETELTSEDGFQWFSWGGSFHVVPQGFRFRSMSVKQIWDYWHYGDRVNRISPYKRIEPGRDLLIKSDRKVFSKAKKVVNSIMKRGISVLNITEQVHSATTLNHIFNVGYNSLIDDIDHNSEQSQIRRYGEISFTTIYNSLKFLPDEGQVESEANP